MNKRKTHILALLGGTELLGKERGNLRALAALASTGVNVTVGVSNREPGGGAVGDEARRLGFDTVEFPIGSHFARRWMIKDKQYRKKQLKRLISNSRQLLALLRTMKPTHIQIGAHDTFLFFALALLINRTPVIHRCGDAPPVESKFQVFIWKWMARRSRTIVAVSHYIGHNIAEVMPSARRKVRVIHNVAPPRNTPLDEGLLQSLHQSKRPTQIVYVGQIAEKKGVFELTRALLDLDDDRLGCWIVGGSPHSKKEEEQLHRMVSESNSKTKVDHIGFTTDPRPYFHAADWHTAPSVYEEPNANVVLEALAAGTPSIVTPRGGMPENITHGVNGFVLEGVHHTDIQDQLAQLLDTDAAAFKENMVANPTGVNDVSAYLNAWKSVVQ